MKVSRVLISAGAVLIAAAVILTGYNLWDTRRAGLASEAALEQLSPLIAEEDPEYPDYVLNPNMSMPIQTVDGLDYVGTLDIPAIDRQLPVLNEWNYGHLKTAPCLYAGSAYLDNMVICAHNYKKHFGSLKNLRYGDVLSFTDMDGNVFEYQVIEIETLKPTAVEEMTEGDWDLTLFTCTLGGASRVTVRCEKLLY